MDDKKDIVGWFLVALAVLCLLGVFWVNGGDVRSLLVMNAGIQPTVNEKQTIQNEQPQIVQNFPAVVSNPIKDKQKDTSTLNQKSGVTPMIGGANYATALEGTFANSAAVIGATFGGVILAFVFGAIGIALLKTESKKDRR